MTPSQPTPESGHGVGEFEPASGYSDAFYAIGKMLDIPAQTASPETVWREQMQPMLALRLGSFEPLLEALQHAVGIIEAHVPRDALGMGGDPRDGMWPLLDEYLHHMKAAIAKAKGFAA